MLVSTSNSHTSPRRLVGLSVMRTKGNARVPLGRKVHSAAPDRSITGEVGPEILIHIPSSASFRALRPVLTLQIYEEQSQGPLFQQKLVPPPDIHESG